MADGEIDREAIQKEIGEKADELLVHALVHYIEREPARAADALGNAISWIEHGQYVMLVRLDDSDQFWRIRDELAKRYGLADPSTPWMGRTP